MLRYLADRVIVYDGKHSAQMHAIVSPAEAAAGLDKVAREICRPGIHCVASAPMSLLEASPMLVVSFQSALSVARMAG